jgi:hypothetical protein
MASATVSKPNCPGEALSCFMPTPLPSTDPLNVLMADQTTFTQSGDKVLKGVCGAFRPGSCRMYLVTT